MALADAGVPHQLHTQPSGGHGWAFDYPAEETWYRAFQQQFITWLASYWPDVLHQGQSE